ncbi:MAG: hypothetical protein ACU0GG_03745 [Paracoccaceae bacterium]
MDRRDFLTRLAAVATAPALPFQALASAQTAATGIAPPNLYTWSTAIARTHGKCSADMLKSMLHIDADKASDLLHRLVQNNVVGPADAFGLCRARAVIPSPTGLSQSVTQLAGPKRIDVDRIKSLAPDDDTDRATVLSETSDADSDGTMEDTASVADNTPPDKRTDPIQDSSD